jgi:hypothetical protein
MEVKNVQNLWLWSKKNKEKIKKSKKIKDA